MKSRKFVAIAAASTFAMGIALAAIASDRPAQRHHHASQGLEMTGKSHFARFCAGARTAALITCVRVQLNLTKAQLPPWRDLAHEMSEGAKIIAASCETRETQKISSRLKNAEILMEAGLKWESRVGPAFDALHAKLNDDQKATLDGMMRYHERRVH